MLDVQTRQRIDTARDILVGKVPDPKSQVEQITLALMYKFMDDMDAVSEDLGGNATFFSGDFQRYSWRNIIGPRIGGHDTLNRYSEGIARMGENPQLPALFRSIFNNAYLPYRDPETLRSFLMVIDEFDYDNSERLGDAFEYLLSIMGSQGDAGQFRTPRHIIDFIVEIVDPRKDDKILDPACGTAGFLISAYKHINKASEDAGTPLNQAERVRLAKNVKGYDISPDMVRLSLVNLYLHNFPDPDIFEYDTLTSEDRWNENANVILANPPFMSPKGGIRPHNRFSVKSRRSEVLFVDYIAEHLTPDGRAGVIVPEGIIFQSQNAHKQLRKMLVEDYLVAVVSLPPGVFNPYSGVKTSVLILDKALARRSNTIGFFKVKNDGFDLGAQRRPIDRNDLPQVKQDVTEYLRRLRSEDGVDESEFRSGSVVGKEKIAEDGEFNLSGERYRVNLLRNSRYRMVPFEAVCTLEYGSALRKKDREPGPYPVMGSNGVSGYHKDYTVEGPAIIVGRKGSAGEVTFVESNCYPIDTTFYVKVVDVEQSDVRYLFHVIKSLDLPSMREGAGIPGINRNDVYREHRLPIPPITVQREIVSEIEGYQRVIDGAQAVVENWQPRIAVDPEWPLVELGEIAEVIAGQSPPGSSYNTKGVGEPFYQGKTEFGDDYIGAPVKWTTDPRRFADTSDILMSVRAPVGPVNLTEHRVCIGRGLAAIRPAEPAVSRNYLYAWLRQLESEISGNTGTAFASINIRDIKRLKVALPPAAIQRALADDIDTERNAVNSNLHLIDAMEQRVQQVIGRLWKEQ